MGVEERKGVQVFFVVLRPELDIQKAYDVGNRIVSGTGGEFGGLSVFSIGTPPRDKHCLSFFVDMDKFGAIVGKIANELGLVAGVDYLVNAAPSFRLVPKPRPPQTAG